MFNAEVAQLAEHQLPKLRVASSSLVFRSGSHIEGICQSGGETIYPPNVASRKVPRPEK